MNNGCDCESDGESDGETVTDMVLVPYSVPTCISAYWW